MAHRADAGGAEAAAITAIPHKTGKLVMHLFSGPALGVIGQRLGWAMQHARAHTLGNTCK